MGIKSVNISVQALIAIGADELQNKINAYLAKSGNNEFVGIES